MTPDRAKRIVAGALVVGTGTAALGDLGGGRLPRVTIAVGGLAAGVLLALLAEVAPTMAASFAAIVLVGALLTSGVPAARQLRAYLGVGGSE